MLPRNLSNAGFILLPTFRKDGERIDYSFVDKDTPTSKKVMDSELILKKTREPSYRKLKQSQNQNESFEVSRDIPNSYGY